MSEEATPAVLVSAPPIASPEKWMSSDITELCKALSQCQAEIDTPKKSKTVDCETKRGGRITYSYADLNDVLQSINKTGPKFGLSHCQVIRPNPEGRICIYTLLMHTSGQFIRGEYRLPPADNNHEMGQNITYGRRYSISPMYGIASEDDTDYNVYHRDGKRDVKPPSFDDEDEGDIKEQGQTEAQKKVAKLKEKATERRLKAEAEAKAAWAEKKALEGKADKAGAKTNKEKKTDWNALPEDAEKGLVTLPEEYIGLDKRLAKKLKEHENMALCSTVGAFKQFIVGKGIMPETTEVKDYPADLIDQVLAVWEEKIEQDYIKLAVPF
jgi:hypothetical protein